jgi:sarcosine oxidase, subunit beta
MGARTPARRRRSSTLGASAHAPLRPETELAVIGGGIMGLAVAYQMARLGHPDAVVLEAHHLAWGASGRNGGGVRQQWSTELNIRLMQESVEICRGFAQEIGVNVWMRQGGYLFLARSEAQLARMQKAIALQNRCDVPTRLLEVSEAKRIVPEIDEGPFVGACYNPTDAIVFPWPFLWGYARAAAKLGVEIHTRTPVTAIHRQAGGGFLLETPKGTLRAARVLNAAGAWSPQVAALLGVELPTWPARHEILSTEPLKPFLGPMVSVLDSGLYFSQSLRGEVVGGITLHEPRQTEIALGSRLRFVEEMARGMIEVIPRFGHLKVVRQWAGPYDMSPDGNPLCGEAPGVPGFFLCCGFVGHGFMMAPVVARYYARHLAGKQTHPLFAAWRPGRFTAGADASRGEDFNIG